MFLLHCDEDDSLVICSESEVIFEDGVKKDEVVQFFYSGKEYCGTIIARSDNEKELKDVRQKIRAQKQRSKQVETVLLEQPMAKEIVYKVKNIKIVLCHG